MSDIAAILRAPFDQDVIEKLPKPTKRDNQKGNCRECGGYHGLPAVHLDYVGHAAVTDRLLKADPTWTWEPMAVDERGLPVLSTDSQGRVVGLWIRLTVGGVTRPGYGSVEPGAFDAEKQLIGDALRNAAMRFGVALDLWSKSDLSEDEAGSSPAPASGEGKGAPPPAAGEPGDLILAAFIRECDAMGVKLKPLCEALGYTPADAKDALRWLDTPAALDGLNKWLVDHPDRNWNHLVSELVDKQTAAATR